MQSKIILPAIVAVVLTLVAAFYFLRKAEMAAPAEIVVTNAWARATPPGASVGAVYLTIENKGGAADRLTGVASPAAQSAMLHQTIEENGVSTMRPADGAIASGATLAMQPGGAHIMLMGLNAPLTDGDMVSVALDFEKAGHVNVTAKVEPLGSDAPAE